MAAIGDRRPGSGPLSAMMSDDEPLVLEGDALHDVGGDYDDPRVNAHANENNASSSDHASAHPRPSRLPRPRDGGGLSSSTSSSCIGTGRRSARGPGYSSEDDDPGHGNDDTGSYASSLSPTKSAFPSSARSIRSAPSTADARGDEELVAQVVPADADPETIVMLDLSVVPKRTRRMLKSLRAVAPFSTLRELNVAGNAVTSVEGIEGLQGLETLVLARNHLKRLDAGLFALTQLRRLDLSGNFIAHIPRGIASLALLESLSLAGNNLSALKEIDVLARLGNLHTCALSANPFCKLPTYKDYVISKLMTLERLDEHDISEQSRERSRRRFSEDMFSKDKCLREAGLAHATEQHKLRELQSALEAENERLKGELQLKSKLLQNKSKAWSSANEQLLQLQQELAMMNLDRRGSSPSILSGLDLGNQLLESYPTKVPSSDRSHEHNLRHGDGQQRSDRSPKRMDSAVSPIPVDRRLSPQKAPCSWHHDGPPSERNDAPQVHTVKDSRQPSPRPPIPESRTLSRSNDQPSHNLITEDDDDHDHGNNRLRSSLRFPTFEDDSGCPAYEDAQDGVSSQGDDGRNLSIRTGIAHSREDSDSPLDIMTPRSRLHRQWSRQQERLRIETMRSPQCTPRKSQIVGLVDKENLVRQIQALQSCKQSLVADIAKEEQLLHTLKREKAEYCNQIERLETELEVLLGVRDAKTKERRRNQHIPSRQREQETIRAKLEMLRSKLHFAEDNEKEIEATIVRLTKKALEVDILQASEYVQHLDVPVKGGPFDKEIFALTHKLQLVIIEKEDIHNEMSRLINQLQDVGGLMNTSTSGNRATGLSKDALLLLDQQQSQHQAQVVDPDHDVVFIEQQNKLENLKKRRNDVQGRIQVKEDLIATYVAELKDVENELAYINDLRPQTPVVHRRALSLDSQPGSLAGLIDEAENAQRKSPMTRPRTAQGARAAAPHTIGMASPMKLSSLTTSQDIPDSISSIVEAAALDANKQLELKFRELLSDEVVEDIKREIMRKLTQQFPEIKPTHSGHKAFDPQGLRDAIASALDTHVKNAMDGFVAKLEDKSRTCSDQSSSSPIGTKSPPKFAKTEAYDSNQQEDTAFWDQVDDFAPIETSYTRKYRFVKGKANMTNSSEPALKAQSRSAGALKILKACERLEAAEADCRIDTVSAIEVDGNGRKKSSLKVLVMGAKDLPTAHLRTKNLDPYVAIDIVYPDHVLPKPKPDRTSLQGSSLKLALIDDSANCHQSFRTRTVKKSLYPVWDEEFEFSPVESLKGHLRIRILNDRKLSREQLIGEARVPLRSLVHQKKAVENFNLRVIATPDAKSSSRRQQIRPCAGLIRLQLQLSFSRLERYKRHVDELVTKYLHEHNHLPPFIITVDEFLASRLEDDTVDSDGRQADSITTVSLAGISQAPAMSVFDTDGTVSRHRETTLPSPVRETTAVGQLCSSSHKDTVVGASPTHTVLSSARSSSLWAVPSTRDVDHKDHTSTKSQVSTKTMTMKAAPQVAKDTRRQSARSPPTKESSSSSASARAAMALLRQPVKASAQAAATSSIHASARVSIGSSFSHSNASRRRTVVAPASGPNSDCFDEYSPYHPAFQLLDPMEDKSRGVSSITTMTRSHLDDAHRRTNLRIFKSPGFSRREPSGGFPERFIGLDSQTSERIKRIFGRIDAT